MRILVVEDDEYVAKSLESILGNQRYVVDVAYDGEIGWQLVESFSYDLILLDVMLPKLDGIQLCEKLRKHNYQTPILLLTAQNSSTNKVMGLDAGADDYVVKPFEFTELLARIRVLLRRRNAPICAVMEWENLRLDPYKCEVKYDGQLLNLTPKEYRLLELFLRNAQQVYSRGEILEHLWSVEEAPQEDTVTAHIKGLRHKLKQAGAPNNFIETVYGLGYRLRVPASMPMRSHSPSTSTQVLTQKQVLTTVETRTALTQVWERLKGQNRDRIAILEQASNALLTNTLEPELLQQAEQAAHKLAGALGIFGFASGSQLAKQVEDMLSPQIILNPSDVRKLNKLIAALRQELLKPAFTELHKVILHYVDDASE